MINIEAMNINFNNIKKIFAISTAVLLGSCSESFLEPQPLSFYAPENVLVDENGLQAVLDNALIKLRDEYCTDQAPFMVNMKYSDLAVDGSTDKATPWQDLNKQMTPDGQNNHFAYTRIGWYWDESYRIIKDCNTVITRIDQAEFSSEASKKALLGSAYFLRAYRYYTKTLQYGDVPLVLEELSSPKLDFYSTTKESIWLKMIKDLEFAAQNVPEANLVNRGQVTKAACKHLLAKYYLLEGRFDDAIKITSEIIDGGIHNLNTQRFGIDKNVAEKDVVWDMFRIENKSIAGNTEGLLMAIDRYGIEGNSAGTRSMYNIAPYYGLTGVIKTPNGANGMSDKAGLEIGLVEKYGRGIARIRPTYYAQKGVWRMNGAEDNTDYRHRKDNGNWMTMENLVYNNSALKTSNNPWYGKNLQLHSDNGTLLCLDTIRCWFEWPHYKAWVQDPDQVQPKGGPGDWYIFRLAETYLLRAEAYVWKGEWQKAANDINEIRQRANAQTMYTASDIQTQKIGAVLDERARELYYEELRKVELTRMAMIYAKTGIQCYNGKIYTMDRISEDNFWYDRVVEVSDFYNKGVKTPYGNFFTCSPFHIFWPIPSSAINSNTSGIINQNKGYVGVERNVPPLVYSEE
ncbi:RagB/SusD family nutrient uptake outer membrane protein [Gaoshiqia sediminis]|uniref:RagB/SusD family nutrient uptake outer membrane protein n=1 Tax=Gaoshiqia sediminis TaxID=2986998 RepID=A0AA42CB64_9BACT|nr:RagB/SusD family nutrient uptake outer membrane protein [Gaoshiqia sediminis]MCW0484550.1 RagB/SusD family nutrient uptake outer membrane protein [Gaoshiqia sediminis]